MSGYGAYDTQRLTRASFQPIAVREIRKRVLGIAVAVALLVAAGAGSSAIVGRLGAPLRVAALEQQNTALLADVERARLELEMERATRAELQRQIDGLNAQVSELTHQIGFVNSRRPD